MYFKVISFNFKNKFMKIFKRFYKKQIKAVTELVSLPFFQLQKRKVYVN